VFDALKFDMHFDLAIPPGRLPLMWCLIAFLLTFFVTRTIVRYIRAHAGSDEPRKWWQPRNIGHGSLHINADWVVLEPVDREYRPVAPGQPSHTVLLTNLANRIAPIIRYDLGDSITCSAGPCGCGSPLPSIRAEGRCDDVLALASDDGTTVRLSPLAVTTVLEEAMPNGRFQLVQTGPGSLDLRISAADDDGRQLAWRNAQAALQAYLAQQSLPNVQIRLADEAPMPDVRSGKLREVVAEHRAGDASIEESRFAVPLERPEKAPGASRRGITTP